MPLLILFVAVIVVVSAVAVRYVIRKSVLHPHELARHIHQEWSKEFPQTVKYIADSETNLHWIYDVYQGVPFACAALSLQQEIPLVVEWRTKKQWSTAIRISMPVHNPNHRDVVLYRHPDTQTNREGALVEIAPAKNLDVLSVAQQECMAFFIRRYNGLRYRSMNAVHPMIVPPAVRMKEGWGDENMVLSVEIFTPEKEKIHLPELLNAMHILHTQLSESPDTI